MLAGSRPGRDAFAESFGTDLKALIPVGGEPMVRRPVRALLASKQVGEVIVLTPGAGADCRGPCRRPRARIRALAAARSPRPSLALCDDPAVEWPLLVTTADHALLDAGDGRRILPPRRGAPTSRSALSSAERCCARFPDTQRTWLRFRGGAYTRRQSVRAAARPRSRRRSSCGASVEQDRKKGWRLLSLLGPAMLLGVGAAPGQPRRGAGAASAASSG